MDQITYLKRPKPTFLHINIPRVKPVAEVSVGSGRAMSYNHHRPISPGGRRMQNPARASENSLTDPYYSQRHGLYASPRSSGVIPISTQTFVNSVPCSATIGGSSSSRPEPRYDSYSGRPRRSSLVEMGRASTTQLPIRGRPTVIQQDIIQSSNPSKLMLPVQPVQSMQPPRDYYITPASSQEPRTTTTTHKKLYSVDDGTVKLVADVNIPVQPGSDRHHKRRESCERSGYRASGVDRVKRTYHVNGTHNKPRDKDIEDEDAYSYTDPASMYKDTEPRWRETRPRRGSMDRGGAASRERPASVLDPTFGTRPFPKDIGPPPSTRGWDKINEIGRTRSVRETPREVAQSPTRGRTNQEQVESRDPYYVPPRTRSSDRRTTTTVHNYESYDYDREPRRAERRHSVTRDSRADKSVERRGFGIRTDLRNGSQTRYAGRDGRGSDESIEHQKYRDSGYAEPHRRDTAPEFPPQDLARLEQEKRDRETALRLQNEEFGRARERSYSDVRDFSREPRRRDDDSSYEREYERERDRDRERPRPTEPSSSDRDRERHHHRRDTDRDREYNRKDVSPKQSSERTSLGQAATGGLAGAAAALGLTSLLNKVSEKREKDKDDHQERDRERERIDRKERGDRRSGEERDPPRDKRQAEPVYERDPERDRNRDGDRGAAFPYEAPPDRPKSTQPSTAEKNPATANLDRSQESVGPRAHERDRTYDNTPYENKSTAEIPTPAVDPDEDYRRRMEQVQRELGRSSEDQRASDSDADRSRRRREREQRQRERESRGGVSAAGSFDAGFTDTPSHPSSRHFDKDGFSSYPPPPTTASTVSGDLKRRPSILDIPMAGEQAQIIDNSLSEKRENRVRIVDPPTEEEERKPKGILKRPTEKFPEDPNAVREGVAPLKDATKKGIPPGARWTKIDRRLVNPEALEAAHERFEERLDCVIVLRVLTKEEIQKLADRTREIRDRRYEEERGERKASRRPERNRDRRDRDEYEYSDSEDEFKPKQPKMLEAPSTAGASNDADFIREYRDRRNEREREAEPAYMSGGLGRRDETQSRY